MEQLLWKHIQNVRTKSPLVHNITNYVVMNNTANALLAIGASPIMAHAHQEVDEMVNICQALVINIGTLDEYWTVSMIQAAKAANRLGKPWILDPVGAGATSYRDTTLEYLLSFRPTVIRGNASEILALAKLNQEKTKGVDSTAHSKDAVQAAQYLNEKFGSTVCISGETDIVVAEGKELRLFNGNALMTKVTGLGCTATSIIGAFIAVTENVTEAAAAAISLLNIAGEIVAKNVEGPGSLQMHLLDKLYNLTQTEFDQHIKLSA